MECVHGYSNTCAGWDEVAVNDRAAGEDGSRKGSGERRRESHGFIETRAEVDAFIQLRAVPDILNIGECAFQFSD